jgi:hypothetical protein
MTVQSTAVKRPVARVLGWRAWFPRWVRAELIKAKGVTTAWRKPTDAVDTFKAITINTRALQLFGREFHREAVLDYLRLKFKVEIRYGGQEVTVYFLNEKKKR